MSDPLPSELTDLSSFLSRLALLEAESATNAAFRLEAQTRIDVLVNEVRTLSESLESSLDTAKSMLLQGIPVRIVSGAPVLAEAPAIRAPALVQTPAPVLAEAPAIQAPAEAPANRPTQPQGENLGNGWTAVSNSTPKKAEELANGWESVSSGRTNRTPKSSHRPPKASYSPGWGEVSK